MDISQVYMVRSAKGNDMLCVDSFLYYYDGKGVKTYRWHCSKRKDKILPCKSRLVTNIQDDDESKHVVVKFYGDHSHDRCSAEEISVAFERKRMANLEGKPCTFDSKFDKRKAEGDNENHTHETGTPPKKRLKNAYENDHENDTETGSKDLSLGTSFSSSENTSQINLKLEESTVYMLKTSHGKDMICVDGYLYRFEGKSEEGSIHRWECCRRRDDRCKARLRTERKSNGSHILKEKRLTHTHEPYSQAKLLKLFNKHNVNLYTNEDCSSVKVEKAAGVEEFEAINCMGNSKYLNDMQHYKVGCGEILKNFKNDTVLELSDIETMFDMDEGDSEEKVESTENHEKGMNVSDEKDSEEKEAPNTSEKDADPLEGTMNYKIKTDFDITKIRTLPSAKGNKLLCIDNYLYHYDSKSTNQKRSYWTCIHRRDNAYNCRARITTEIMSTGAIKVIKVYGKHKHPNDIDKIRQRIFQNYVATEDKSIKPNDFLNSSIQELNSKFKDIIQNSKESLKRKIAQKRFVNKKISFDELQQKIKTSTIINDNDNLSISSISDYDMDLPELPTNLEQMKANIQDISNVKIENSYYNQNETLFKNENSFGNIYNDFEDDDDLSNDSESPDNQVLESDMDLSKISILRSAKGRELLCVDDYIYHVKSLRDVRTYWECIKSKTPSVKCRSRITSVMTTRGYSIRRVTNRHNHPTSKTDIQKRLINSCKEKSDSKPNDYMILLERKMMYLEQKLTKVRQAMQRQNKDKRTVMKLYAVSDGPPSLAVRMTLKALKIAFELIDIDFCAGEHLTEEYAKLNPQKEIPVLDDEGFYVSESIAIMQYICDKYAPYSEIYPKDAKKRAVVNHRLCFNMGFYYPTISAYVMAPIFFDYPRNEMGLKKVNNALSVFETYLKRTNTRFAADDHLTIADFALVSSTLCLEAIEFDLSPYPFVKHWYENFKEDFPQLWEIGKVGMREIENFEHNPPDLSKMNHPFHPTRKVQQ